MGMYEVCAKCGHVGRNYYVDKIFAVKAASGKEAAAKVRSFPRVKHDHKDAIRYVECIGAARFADIISANHLDPFFLCANVQEQRRLCHEGLDIHFDDQVKRGKKQKTGELRGRPKLPLKRISSAELLYCYYREVNQVC